MKHGKSFSARKSFADATRARYTSKTPTTTTRTPGHVGYDGTTAGCCLPSSFKPTSTSCSSASTTNSGRQRSHSPSPPSLRASEPPSSESDPESPSPPRRLTRRRRRARGAGTSTKASTTSAKPLLARSSAPWASGRCTCASSRPTVSPTSTSSRQEPRASCIIFEYIDGWIG